MRTRSKKDLSRIEKSTNPGRITHADQDGNFAIGEVVTNDVESTTNSLDEETELSCNPTSDNGLSSNKMRQVMATYNKFERSKYVEKSKPDREDSKMLSEQPMRSKHFGSPGPPLTDLMDDFDELTEESSGSLSSGSLDCIEGVKNNSTQNIVINSDIPSMSTLSQDDMTIDAEMGRPPRITAAGRALQRQQQQRETQTRDDQEEKQRLRQPEVQEEKRIPRQTEQPYADRGRVSNGPSLDHGKQQDLSQKKDEETIMDFIKQLAKDMNKPAPTVKLFDAAILYDKKDYENVKEFMAEIQMIATKQLQEDIRIELFDSEEFAQSQVMVVADVVERCSVVFIYITSNSNTDFFNFFCDEAVGMSRLGLNNHWSQTGFPMNDRRWMLKPVHTQPIKTRNYRTPVGLLTLIGVEWYDWPQAHVRDKIMSILNAAITRRKNAESEKNITLSYERAFSKDNVHSQSYNRAPSFPKEQPTRMIPRSFRESVDAFSLPDIISHASFPKNRPILPQTGRPPQLPQYPAHHLTHGNYRQQTFSPQSNPLHQQQRYLDQGQPPLQYAVNQNYQSAQNPYQSQMFAPHMQPNLYNVHYGPPPTYQSHIMQDHLSYMYPQNIVGPHGYLGGPPATQISHVPRATKNAGDFQNQVSPHSYSRQGRQNYHQKYNGSINRDADPIDSVCHYGAAFGSLMRDQKDDTPPSHELNVVSRLTGKLITNPNLSNDDLEIDTGEKHGKVPVKSNNGKERKRDETSDSSGDSESDSNEEGDDIGNLFPGKGKVINIIGSGVVQLGKNNKAVERYRTKRVYQRLPKERSGGKVEKRMEEDKEIVPDDTKRYSCDDGGPAKCVLLNNKDERQDDQCTDRDNFNLRKDNNLESRTFPLNDQNTMPYLSRPAEDVKSFPVSTNGDRVRTGVESNVTDSRVKSNVTDSQTKRYYQTSVSLNNLDQEIKRSQSQNKPSTTYHNEDPKLYERNDLQLSLREDLRQGNVEHISTHNVACQGQHVDDAEILTSIDDNTYEPANIEIQNDDELFVTSGSGVGEHEHARFLFSSFRTSRFSKPSSIASDVNTETVIDEQDDVD